MEETLFLKFLEETGVSIDILFFSNGIGGILQQFENWLIDNHYLKTKNGRYVKVGD